VTDRPPLWTPEEARADAEREGESEDNAGRKVGGCLVDGCFMLVPFVCLVLGLFLWMR
jgi:hypothetical protein